MSRLSHKDAPSHHTQTNPSHQPNASNTPHNPQKHKPETTKDTKTPSMAQQEERHRKDTKRHRCVEKLFRAGAFRV